MLKTTQVYEVGQYVWVRKDKEFQYGKIINITKRLSGYVYYDIEVEDGHTPKSRWGEKKESKFNDEGCIFETFEQCMAAIKIEECKRAAGRRKKNIMLHKALIERLEVRRLEEEDENCNNS